MEQVIQGFRGLFRQSDSFEMEKVVPNFLAGGYNVVNDLMGNLYIMTGYVKLADLAGNSLTSLHYSPTLNRIVAYDVASGDVHLIHPETGVVTTAAAALATNRTVTFADWPATSFVYMSDGSSYKKINADGVVTNLTGVAPLGAGIIFVHKNHMFSAGPATGTSKNHLYPSTLLNPEAFSSTDEIYLDEDGNSINGMSTLGGILQVHKQSTIYTIVGDSFAGSAKDLQVINDKHGAGALFPSGRCSFRGVEYFIGYDGLYRYNGQGVERIGAPLDGLLADKWAAPPTRGNCVPFTPTWGPDNGRKYIFFHFATANDIVARCFRYDISTSDWMEVKAGIENMWSATHSAEHNRTFFATTDVFQFANTSKADGADIAAQAITNPLDGNTRVSDKLWQKVISYPCDHAGLKVFVGLDGLYPTLDVSPDSGQSVADLPKECTSQLISFRFERGAEGGTPLMGGFSVEFEVDPTRDGRSWAFSRKQSVDTHMTYAPLLYGNIADVADGTANQTITISPEMPTTPAAVFVCAANFTVLTQIVVTSFARDYINFTLPAAGVAGQKVYWVAIMPNTKRLYDSFMRGGTGVIQSVVHEVYHNLDATPQAVFMMKSSNGNFGHGLTDLDARRFKTNPQAAHPRSDMYWMAFRQGSTDAYFKCGSASASPIAHGLGTTPRAAIIFPNSNATVNHGINSVSSTELAYTGAGTFYWMVMK